MKGVLVLALMFTFLLPQVWFVFDWSLNECCGVQYVVRNPGLFSANGYVDVNVSEARQMIESDRNLVVLDVRTQEEYDGGHIENATWIPVSELAGRLGELDKGKEILVYCRLGGRSVTASQILVDNGFSKVYNMLGGITAWMSAGYWIEIVHDADLVVDGAQTVTIENCVYVEKGNIYVRNSGILILRNAELKLSQTEMGQYKVEVRDSGTLEARGAFVTSEYAFEMSFYWNSRFYVTNTTFLSDTPIIIQPIERILGDINGDFTVDVLDAIRLADSFYATPDKLNWNPNADINGDNIVNILDAIILSSNFYEHST